jgi:hypothetical protein
MGLRPAATQRRPAASSAGFLQSRVQELPGGNGCRELSHAGSHAIRGSFMASEVPRGKGR